MDKDKHHIKLVKSAIRGNTKSFEILIKDNKNYFYRMAYLRTNNEDIALDVLQNSIIKAYKSIKTLKNAENFNTWFCRIIINAANDYYRKNSRELSLEAVPESFAEIASDTDIQLDMRRAVSALPQNYRTAIELRYYSDLKTKEIAKHMAVPENTVSSYISRGKKQIKEILGKDYLSVNDDKF